MPQFTAFPGIRSSGKAAGVAQLKEECAK